VGTFSSRSGNLIVSISLFLSFPLLLAVLLTRKVHNCRPLWSCRRFRISKTKPQESTVDTGGKLQGLERAGYLP
jgi:hypothetical protein